MKVVLLFLSIAVCHITTNAAKCTRPNLSRATLYVYSNIGKMSVQVNRCNFKGTKEAYSDISDNCLKAFKSGIFIDKWSEENNLSVPNSPAVTEAYVTKADLAKNEIYLKSGSICRYDRGFCFDPINGNTYAVVWEILERSKVECASELYKVFEGEVDIWDFQPQGLSYLFYYDDFRDDAFYLSLKSRGRCQDNDVWFTQGGYIVSRNPLNAKEMEENSALKIKNDKKVGVKGGVKGGKIKYLPPTQNYFYLRSKKVVSEDIMKNCEILTLGNKEMMDKIDPSYIETPQNLRLFLKRYYDLIDITRENILTIVKDECTSNITLDLKRELTELSQRFEKTLIDIKEIRDILEAAGDLKGIKIDVDKLASQITTLLKKNEEYNYLFEQLSTTVNKNVQMINDKDLELQSLSKKLESLQSTINNQLPNLITKVEVYDKLNEVEQQFHNKVKELTMNVTLLLLQHESSNGVKGKGTTNAELENLVLDKLSSFNLDQQQAAIDALRDKTDLLVDQLRSECYNNDSILEENVMKKISLIDTHYKPIFDRSNDMEKNIAAINITINNLKLDMEEGNKQFKDDIMKLQSKILNLSNNSSYLEQMISELREDVTKISEKEVDFTPVYENINKTLSNEFKERDQRLDSLDDITAKLAEYYQKSTTDIDTLQKQLNDTNDFIKNMDGVKENITDNMKKEVKPLNEGLDQIHHVVNDHSEKHTTVQSDLEETENNVTLELNILKTNISEIFYQLNSTLIENSESINKLLGQDNVMNDRIDHLKEKVNDQEKSIDNLKTVLEQKINECETTINNTSGLVDNLKENVTEIYDAIKQHEGSILELIKDFEKVTAVQSATKASSTKGGVKADSGLERELYFLRTQLTGAHLKISDQERKIARLQKQSEQLFVKLVNIEDIFARSVKSVNGQVQGTNERIDFLEYDINSRLASCCNKKSNYQGVKH